ncbi:MAG: hypothetical protein HY431_02415 [Candidatus Levybacteria bacterium]|nr:hypothetical protein [Candidatus Levybacteria bacterium]
MATKNLPIIEPFNFKKHLPQTAADKTSDLFYILSAIYIASEEEKEVSRISLIKALFKTEQIEAEKKISFLNTFFYVNTLGPYNNIVFKYLEELEKANLIKTEGVKIYITPKGSRVFSELINTLSDNKQLIDVLLTLKSKIIDYAGNVSRAINDTHSQKIIDTTDGNKEKTIESLIKEIKPEQQFKKASQFKYINPFKDHDLTKVSLPAELINKLEVELANIEPNDYERIEDITSLFA